MGLVARTAGEGLALGLRGKLTGADNRDFHERTAERYAQLLGHSKGVLMKAGQMLSLALAGPAVPADLRSLYHTSLARLRNEAPPMAPELAREALERAVGRRTESAFAQFDWEPLAAASIGQVHAARLHDGREVAVKIQYPGVADAIAADLKNAELLFTFINLIAYGFSPRRVGWDVRGYADELRAHIAEELDYRIEAANQAEFAERYRGHPFIHVPDVIPELCTDRVLTQELVRGIAWNDALVAKQTLRDRWAEAIHRFFYGSYHRFRSTNADPHPGNFLFHDDGSVSFLDYGCVKRFRRDYADMMDAALRACLRNDALGTWRAAVELGFWRSSDPVTPEEVITWWRSPLLCSQRHAATPESLAQFVERRHSLAGPCGNAIRYATPRPDCSIMVRIELGVYSASAQLRARVDWRAIATEHLELRAPRTQMGKQEQAFFARRDQLESPTSAGARSPT